MHLKPTLAVVHLKPILALLAMHDLCVAKEAKQDRYHADDQDEDYHKHDPEYSYHDHDDKYHNDGYDKLEESPCKLSVQPVYLNLDAYVSLGALAGKYLDGPAAQYYADTVSRYTSIVNAGGRNPGQTLSQLQSIQPTINITGFSILESFVVAQCESSKCMHGHELPVMKGYYTQIKYGAPVTTPTYGTVYAQEVQVKNGHFDLVFDFGMYCPANMTAQTYGFWQVGNHGSAAGVHPALLGPNIYDLSAFQERAGLSYGVGGGRSGGLGLITTALTSKTYGFEQRVVATAALMCLAGLPQPIFEN